MKISARIENSKNNHQVFVSTNGIQSKLEIPPKPQGFGSSVNGGELLFLALATCYCNDLYREAAKLGIAIDGVEVNVDGEFGAAGEPAKHIRYRAKVKADAPSEQVEALLRQTDKVAEIHNTLRRGIDVRLEGIEAIELE